MTNGRRQRAAMPIFIVTLLLVAIGLYLQFSPKEFALDDPWGFAGMEGLLSVCFGTVGFIILRRTSNPSGWIFTLMGLGSAIQYIAEEYSDVALSPGSDLPGVIYVAWVAEWIWVPLMAGAGLLLLLFPDERIQRGGPRVIAGIGAFFALTTVFGAAFLPPEVAQFGTRNPFAVTDSMELYEVTFTTSVTLMMLTLFAAAVSLVRRLRSATGIRRQQLKWFAFAAVIASIGNIVGAFPATMEVGSKFAIGGLILIAVSAARAILRYRLYDIDVIVNRALVYGLSTTLIVAVYVVLVFGVQGLVSGVNDSDVAIAGSTLLAAALFRPLRDRVQRFVDRRFYRSKYSSERTMNDFSTRLRNQVELDSVRHDLLDVVGRTVQPAHASLWLKAGSQ